MEWNEITQRLKEIEIKKQQIEEFEDILKILKGSVYSAEVNELCDSSSSRHSPQAPSVMCYLFRFFNIPNYRKCVSTSSNHMLKYSQLNYKTRMMIDIEKVVLKYKNELQLELKNMLNIEKK